MSTNFLQGGRVGYVVIASRLMRLEGSETNFTDVIFDMGRGLALSQIAPEVVE
jgi:hypothetical protein